jgi:GTPase
MGAPAGNSYEEHDELNILDQLELAEESNAIRLKHVLLDRSETAEGSVNQLTEYIHSRLEEGHGEALFDLGIEDSGELMGFSKEDWDFAVERVLYCANKDSADCRILITRNVGGDLEVGPSNAKDTLCSGKVMIRRRPASVDDVIETRIVVVGNGMEFADCAWHSLLIFFSRRWEEYHVRCACKGWSR